MTIGRIRRLVCSGILLSLVLPAAANAGVPEKLPGDTVLYIGWPGRAQLEKAFGDTAMAKLMAEPQMQPLRKNMLPAIDAFLKGKLEADQGEGYARAKQLLVALYNYPVGLALVRIEAASIIPMVDAGLIVEAGDDAAELAKSIDVVLEHSQVPMERVKTVKVGPWTMKQFDVMGPNMALRWGVVDKDLVVTFGNKMLRKLVPTFMPASQPSTQQSTEEQDGTAKSEHPKPAATAPVAKSLAENPMFIKALATSKATAGSPIIFINLKNVIHSLETFQPMLAAFQLPVLGEEGGVQRVLKESGLQNIESFSMAWTAQEKGLYSTTFFHCPSMPVTIKPLTNEDFTFIPKDVSWASAGNMDMQMMYHRILTTIQSVSPKTHEQVTEAIAEGEKRIGMKIDQDVLGSFGDTWMIYDEPGNGSLLFTGITLIAEVKPESRIDEAVRKLVVLIDEENKGDKSIAVQQEDYRGQKIAYVNFKGLPVPCAPAWATCQGRLVAALFPQMVRVAIDHMLDKGPSLLDNQGFRRGWALMPANASSMNYVDAPRGMRHLYSILLPVADALVAMGQKEGVALDATLLPSLTVINKHLFDNVSAGAVNADGYIAVSYGAVPSLGSAAAVAPVALATSIMLPALARARELSKRTVSAANLKGIGLACLIYAEAHKGKLPPNLKVLVEERLPPKTLISPSDPNPGEEGSYIYLGDGLVNTMSPQTIVAYEKTDIHHGEGTNVLFLDGHVQFMNMNAFNSALEETKKTIKKQGGGQIEEEKAEEQGQQPAIRLHQVPPQTAAGKGGRKARARAILSKQGPLAVAIDTYKLEVGRYPSRLDDLVTRPSDESIAKKWSGPYIKDEKSLNDPWGRPFKYLMPGEFNEKSYDIWSAGPDGESGTEDDIGNFEKQANK